MTLKRLLIEVLKQRPQASLSISLYSRSYTTLQKFRYNEANKLQSSQKRFLSSYLGSFTQRSRDNVERSINASYLRELSHRNDPEAVIRVFESQPSLHSSPSALNEYIRALVKVDRLDDSELLKTLQRGSDGGVTTSLQLSRNSRPPMLDHQDKYMMKAQVHVSKSFAISDIQALPRRKYHRQHDKSIKW
nr:ATP-dependent zinc metalloprotease FTSH 4, mitochondrial-like [Tanacetum cinerariifolium]